jgi:hypothetical protein
MYGHSLSHRSLHPELAPGLSGVPAPQNQPTYGSDIDDHIPKFVLEDNKNSKVGDRKRKGPSSTLAHDDELRKLFHQYEGYNSKQMASEVLKHDGEKAGKLKQVFSMIW